MAILETTVEDIIRELRHALGMPVVASAEIDDALLAALVRHAAAIVCPCSRATLASAVMDGLESIATDDAELRERIDDSIDGLTALGDLLDLSQATVGDLSVKDTWVFVAPPGFVMRDSGTALLLGMAADEAFPLPLNLRDRVVFNRYGRILHPHDGEDLAQALQDFGLLEHAETAWLKGPKEESAEALLDRIANRLASQPPSGEVADLVILDPISKVGFYKGRWRSPKADTGMFVARRPQEYGAPLWGVVELQNGSAQRFLEVPSKANRWRACDEAWLIQMAIDFQRGIPQHYRRREAPEGALLDFFSPIPMWAERHLAVVGEASPPSKCLLSYYIPRIEMPTQEDFLRKRLWLVKVDDTKIMEE